ncbi:MAG: hypothetical protein U5L73_11435 [Rhodoferax sp.]|uniref:hypothetical protein n=1 Tax=Rhodoferax sp. TaxID=50421 RepID=UPI002ACE2E01|nr:hypothetical protein [Rhodoferax sp.]MDZ7892355.1 hypothetical protein [Rhodoferax sp.]
MSTTTNAFNWAGQASEIYGHRDIKRARPKTEEEILRKNAPSNIAMSTRADHDKTLKIIGRRNEARSQ